MCKKFSDKKRRNMCVIQYSLPGFLTKKPFRPIIGEKILIDIDYLPVLVGLFIVCLYIPPNLSHCFFHTILEYTYML